MLLLLNSPDVIFFVALFSRKFHVPYVRVPYVRGGSFFLLVIHSIVVVLSSEWTVVHASNVLSTTTHTSQFKVAPKCLLYAGSMKVAATRTTL